MNITEILDQSDDDKLGYLGDIGKSKSPVQDPSAFPGLPGGMPRRGSGASVWSGPGGERMAKPRSMQKPRITIDQARQAAARQDIPPLVVGRNQPGGPQVWRRTDTGVEPSVVGRNQLGGPQVWRRALQEPQTPQEKMIAQAQAHTQQTGEPVLAVTNPRLAKILDKVFPEPKEKIEPKLTEPKEPVMRAVEPSSNMQTNIDYWNKAMPVNTIGGKIVDKLMGIKSSKIDEDEKAKYSTEQYLEWAKKYSEIYKVPLTLVLHAMHKETGWLRDPEKMRTAKSPTGATGVMQIQPEYAEKGYGIKVKDLLDPEKNIEAGVRGLANYLQKFKTPENALAAYNAGPGGAGKFIKTGDIKFLKPETQKYIKNYKDDIVHNLEKFYPTDKKKVTQLANNLLATAVGATTAQAADEKPATKTSPIGDVAARVKKGEKVSSIAAGKVKDIDQQITRGKEIEARLQAEIEKTKAKLEKIRQGKQPDNKGQKPAGSTYTTVDTQGKQKTYTKNADGDWVTASGEKLPMPTRPSSVAAPVSAPAAAEPVKTKADSAVPMKTLKISAADAKKLPPVELFGHIFPGLELNKAGGIAGVGTKPYTLPDGTVITDKRVLDRIRGLQKLPDQVKSDAQPAKAAKTEPEVPITPKMDRQVKLFPPFEPADIDPADREKARKITGASEPLIDPESGLPTTEKALRAKIEKAKAARVDQEKQDKPVAPVSVPVSAPVAAPVTARKSNIPTSDWGELYRQNKAVIGSDPNLILPGQKLVLPDGTPYEVKTGDTLSKIAAKMKSRPASSSLVDKSVQSFASDIDQATKDTSQVQPANATLDFDLDKDSIQDVIDQSQSSSDSDIPVPSPDEIETGKALSQKHLADIDKELQAKGMNEDTPINNEIKEILKLAGRLP